MYKRKTKGKKSGPSEQPYVQCHCVMCFMGWTSHLILQSCEQCSSYYHLTHERMKFKKGNIWLKNRKTGIENRCFLVPESLFFATPCFWDQSPKRRGRTAAQEACNLAFSISSGDMTDLGPYFSRLM